LYGYFNQVTSYSVNEGQTLPVRKSEFIS